MKPTTSTVELKAPPDQFRVVGVDTFDSTDWVVDDYDTFAEARKVAEKKGGIMLKMHVYDEHGKHLFEAGTF